MEFSRIEACVDDFTSYLIDPSNNERDLLNQAGAWMVTIILGVSTAGVLHGLSILWRNLRNIEGNDTLDKIYSLFCKVLLMIPFLSFQAHGFVSNVQPIDENFTTNKTIEVQREAHEFAKRHLSEELGKRKGIEVYFVSPHELPFSDVDSVQFRPLDSDIFTWENTKGVQGDIQRDAKVPGQLVLYGAASQHNNSEAKWQFTPLPGDAVHQYKGDPTQGPKVQLQFSNEQVEIINEAANLGFNGLCYVLEESTKTAVRHGYFSPVTKEMADVVISQFEKRGNEIEYLCVGSVPKDISGQKKNSEKVYEMLVSQPAFGTYGGGKLYQRSKKQA